MLRRIISPDAWGRGPRHKTALVLSGGGAKGCWQAGAILKLHELGYRYDAYFGVSVGAINAAHMAQFGVGDELLAAQGMSVLWHNFENKDIWKHHSWLKWLGAPWKHSVFDTSPLRSYLDEHLSAEMVANSGKHCAVGAVSMTTGQYRMITGTDPDFVAGVYDSAAFPVMFEMGTDGSHGELMYDGGLVHVTPLGAAIKWGATHVHAITINPEGIPRWEPPQRAWWYPKLLDVGTRAFEVIKENIVEGDLTRCERINEDVLTNAGSKRHRYVDLTPIRPPEPIPVDSLDFAPKPMAEGFKLGYDYVGTMLAG